MQEAATLSESIDVRQAVTPCQIRAAISGLGIILDQLVIKISVSKPTINRVIKDGVRSVCDDNQNSIVPSLKRLSLRAEVGTELAANFAEMEFSGSDSR